MALRRFPELMFALVTNSLIQGGCCSVTLAQAGALKIDSCVEAIWSERNSVCSHLVLTTLDYCIEFVSTLVIYLKSEDSKPTELT